MKNACLNSAFSGVIRAVTTSASPVTFAMTSGSLPTGLSMTAAGKVLTISGTATAVGAFSFTIRATLGTGEYAAKQYTINVAEIAQNSLPDGEVGVAYSEQLTVNGPTTGAEVWSISAGTLPLGLSMNTATGLISGIPSGDGVAVFTVCFTNDWMSCCKEFQIGVVAYFDWGDGLVVVNQYSGTALAEGSECSATGQAIGCVGSPPQVPSGPGGTVSTAIWAILPKSWDGRTLSAEVEFSGQPQCKRLIAPLISLSCSFNVNASIVASTTYNNGSGPNPPTDFIQTDDGNIVIPATDAVVETTATSQAGPFNKGQTGVVFTVADITGFAGTNNITIKGAGLFQITGILGNQITATYLNVDYNGDNRSVAIGAIVTRRTSFNTMKFITSGAAFGGSYVAASNFSVA